jgi:D-sedoheptulose 7-phosphate isomerase
MSHTDQDYVAAYLAESSAAMNRFEADAGYRDTMFAMANTISASLRAGDAQHIAGEFISRLMYDRAPLAAIALTTDTSVITATGNDYGYDYIFERQVLGLGARGDVLLGISTSGKSPNVLRAFAAARDRGLTCLGFTGATAGPMQAATDLLLAAPSTKTAIIQQIHIVAAHVVCALVERAMFPRG